MALNNPGLVPVLACGTLLLTGALYSATGPGSLARLQAQPTGEDGSALLAEVAARYAPDRMEWLEMAIWQRWVDDEGMRTVEGRAILAPGQRCRCDLRTTVGKTRATLQIVSDGQTLWQAQQLGSDPATLAQQTLPPATSPNGDPARLREARELALYDAGLRPVGPLLDWLRLRLREPRQAAMQYHGVPMLCLWGDWPVDQEKLNRVPAEFRPRVPPCQCRVYLEPGTLWPARIEWWGSLKSGPLVLVQELEFRDVIVNRPLPDERCAQLFQLAK